MTDLPEQQFDRVLMLKSMVTSLATGGDLVDWTYRLLRAEFLDDPKTKTLLPQYIRTNIDGGGLWGYMKDIHTGGGAYATRRKHINDTFAPLIDYLADKGVASDMDISGVLSRYDGEGVNLAWQKALERRKVDPEGAITAARTLLEEVCKHILDDADVVSDDNWNLPKLYSETAKLMKLSPSQHNEDVFRKILGGCHSVVQNLGELRNKVSDAHGSGRGRIRPAGRHAALAVNLSGSMAMFLVETWNVQRG